VDDAGAKLEARAQSIYHPVRGKDASQLTLAPFTQNSGHPRFGAYIFLHAQAQLGAPYIGKVLLLSPIVGEFENQDTQMNFIPPRANVLMELGQSGSYPTPKQCEIHTGSEDWQSNPDNVTKFGALVGINVTVVPDGGHNLPHSYVGAVLDNWLSDIT